MLVIGHPPRPLDIIDFRGNNLTYMPMLHSGLGCL